MSRPGGDGRACPSLKSLEQKRDCSSRCQKPKLKFGPWSACKTGKSRYPSATCPGIQSRKIVCSTSDDTEFPIHKCLSPGQSLPMSRRKCINYCKANRKVSQFFQKYDIQNKNMISMIIPTPGPKQSDITVREVGEWSSCFLDDQQTCGTGRKYRTKAQGSMHHQLNSSKLFGPDPNRLVPDQFRIWSVDPCKSLFIS